jgi:hypothetical protein
MPDLRNFTPEQQIALRTAFSLRDIGHPLQTILASELIPANLKEFVRAELTRDENIVLTPARTMVADPNRADWLRTLDRSSWYYWPALRHYLLAVKGWEQSRIRSIEDSSDRVLKQLASPAEERFDVRGLVLGFVQSGKTANYTAVIAKAVDAGYRLVIVLSGIDNGLRRQTNIRLKQELVGYPDNRPNTVRMPPVGKQWHEFTGDGINSDFQSTFDYAALQGLEPVLIVVKKNGAVLRRLLSWLGGAPPEVLRTLPALIIDDEADLASVDTRGTYQTEDEKPDPEYEPPSVINGRIRDLLQMFGRRSYIAYTATPFANVLIPHDTSDPEVGSDLYPKDFIVDLPKPEGYFGAEELFGMTGDATGQESAGLDAIREVKDEDIAELESGRLPQSLENAMMDFVLAGAARAQRGQGAEPATMLIHTSQLIWIQAQLKQQVSNKFGELRDEWRYQQQQGIRNRLNARWNSEFRPVFQNGFSDRDVPFEAIEPHITTFFESVQVREVNSATGEMLDYERDPSLKAIAIGGNRLSRGLTLEGLLISYFIRRSIAYDTLMQMGRWFGFRRGYDDLTRIWTTAELSSWFSDLAIVEHILREDIGVYESQGLTPLEVGMRIQQHHTMQVTGPLKRRFASSTIITQTYSGAFVQTFKFPLRRPADLAAQAENNLATVRNLVSQLGASDPTYTDENGPVWTGVAPDSVLKFLHEYHVDDKVRSVSIPLICDYIEKAGISGELIRWTIAVRGLKSTDNRLGTADWGLSNGPISQIGRTRLKSDSESLGVISEPRHELIGLPQEYLRQVEDMEAGTKKRDAIRKLRPKEEGLLLLYPISRFSGQEGSFSNNRQPLFDNPMDPLARDLVGWAILFPYSEQPQRVEAYLQGTVRWRPAE